MPPATVHLSCYRHFPSVRSFVFVQHRMWKISTNGDSVQCADILLLCSDSSSLLQRKQGRSMQLPLRAQEPWGALYQTEELEQNSDLSY